MANFILDDLKRVFRGENALTQIIVANVIIFVVLNVLFALTGIEHIILPWLALIADGFFGLLKPWTYFTYQFLHGGFFHILFNMLWLYWIGRILTEYQGYKRFTTIYFLGGIAGGLMYEFIGFTTGIVPNGTQLIGASGAVLAVIAATGTLLPNYTIRLFLIGPVPMKYLALGAIIITTLLDFNVNTGGKLAHLGGALFGYIYIKQLQRGKDIGIWFEALTQAFGNFFKRSPKLKVVSKKSVKTPPPKKEHASSDSQARIDAILDKISQSGYDSLTKEERDFLFKASKQ